MNYLVLLSLIKALNMLVIAESENVFRLYNLSTNFLESSNVSLGSVISTNFDNSS